MGSRRQHSVTRLIFSDPFRVDWTRERGKSWQYDFLLTRNGEWKQVDRRGSLLEDVRIIYKIWGHLIKMMQVLKISCRMGMESIKHSSARVVSLVRQFGINVSFSIGRHGEYARWGRSDSNSSELESFNRWSRITNEAAVVEMGKMVEVGLDVAVMGATAEPRCRNSSQQYRYIGRSSGSLASTAIGRFSYFLEGARWANLLGGRAGSSNIETVCQQPRRDVGGLVVPVEEGALHIDLRKGGTLYVMDLGVTGFHF